MNRIALAYLTLAVLLSFCVVVTVSVVRKQIVSPIIDATTMK